MIARSTLPLRKGEAAKGMPDRAVLMGKRNRDMAGASCMITCREESVQPVSGICPGTGKGGEAAEWAVGAGAEYWMCRRRRWRKYDYNK
ncbi:MAG: hypothetical protein HFH84_09720 [Lachnospiraceae bacterium]|mgnify:FL=1|nr:hypothetical protein [Lachnospiraceae bacterium]